MDNATAYRVLTARAEDAFQEDGKARTRLTDAVAIDGAQLDGLMDAALNSAGRAKPWRKLVKRMEIEGPREALAKTREEAIEVLLHWGFGMSTSLVSNAQRLAEQDGLRRFLSATDGMEISEDETRASAEKLPPAPELAPVEIPKVTPAQKRTLEAIRANGVTLRWSGHSLKSRTMVHVETGERPRVDMVEFVIDRGWAHWTSNAPMSKGRGVALTPAGEAALAG